MPAFRPRPRCHSHSVLLVHLLLVALLSAPPALTQSSQVSADLFSELQFRHIGPLGNRVTAVAGTPDNDNLYFAGAASGGVFRSRDGGASWQAVFDGQEAASIGDLEVAPSDPNVVWVGTGEAFIRSNIAIGNGVYRSTDSGDTWQHLGLEKTGRIARIAVHPHNPDVAFAAALGHCYGPQQERGVYRTTDGGRTWQQVLFVDEDTGAVDVVINPSNPRQLFAAMWQIRVWTAGRTSGGPGSGLYVSNDGGESWESLEGQGLPDKPWGRIGLALTAADAQRVYALIETSSNPDFAPADPFQGVLWRSDDGGKGWQLVSRDNNLTQRPLYYTRAEVSPVDPDEIRFMAVRHSLSKDGGHSSEAVQDLGWDRHDLWIDPRNPKRIIVGHDGGVSVSTDGGQGWRRPLLPNAQMYHVHVDDRVPYWVYGNRQDGPALRGPSNTLSGGAISIGEWRSVGGCEVGMAVPVPGSSAVWTGCFDGILERHDLATGHSRDVSVWPVAVESWPGEDLRYRWQWSFPIALSPHEPETVYVGSQFVHRSRDRGQSWQTISPDLTTDDPELQRRTGGLTLDDAGPTLAPVVFALAESSLEKGLLWAGTNDGQVQLSRDGGETWSNVTEKLRGLPPLGTVSNIEPSRHDPGTAYLTVDRHQENDSEPYVYKTENYGSTWQRIDKDLPRSVFGYAHCVREDPVRPGMLYLGTGNNLHLSLDDGKTWHSLRTNLPPAPVSWLTVQEHFGDLVVATYGRGFWILDDLSALRGLDETALQAEAHLFAPRPTYRFRAREAIMAHQADGAAGTNPEPGAILHYRLAADTEAAVSLRILNAEGEVVRTLDELSAKAGLHRVVWNLRHERTPEIKLRTPAENNPHITVPHDPGHRRLSDGGRMARLAAPGRYSLELVLEEEGKTQTLEQPLEIRRDPSTVASAEDIARQGRALQRLQDLVSQSAELVNDIELLRRGIDQRIADLQESEGTDELITAAEDLDRNLRDIESAFFDLRLTGAGQDSLRWKRLLYARLMHLARLIDRTDARPTDAQEAVLEELASAVLARQEELDSLYEGELARFETELRGAGVPHLLSPRFNLQSSEPVAAGTQGR